MSLFRSSLKQRTRNDQDNCAYGSHKALIEEADLVIIEGVTAARFEALEHRKPLLLLNKSPERTLSIPAVPLRDLNSFGIYWSNYIYIRITSENPVLVNIL